MKNKKGGDCSRLREQRDKTQMQCMKPNWNLEFKKTQKKKCSGTTRIYVYETLH